MKIIFEPLHLKKMKKFFLMLAALGFGLIGQFTSVSHALAAGISASGGGTYVVGQNFTVKVTASGAEFDSLQGIISISGPVSVVSFSAGSATWLPGKSPSNGGQFVGIVNPTKSLTVATITLKGTKEGKGSVSVSGVQLARNGGYVGSSGGSTSFTVGRAPTPPGQVTVSSTTHPDPNESYEATTIQLAWEPPANGATGYSAILDQVAETAPPQSVTTAEKTATYENLIVGTHYFHIRAVNGDGWSATTHFKINVKPAVDESLAVPVISEITTTDSYQNDIDAGALSGVVLRGTGPAGYNLLLVFAPEIVLPAEKYPAPVIDGEGNWEMVISDYVKAGFYKVTAQASKEGVVSAVSPATAFEVQVADGGGIRMISATDETTAYKQAEATRVLAAKKRATFTWGGIGLFVLGGLAVGFIIWRRRMLPRN